MAGSVPRTGSEVTVLGGAPDTSAPTYQAAGQHSSQQSQTSRPRGLSLRFITTLPALTGLISGILFNAWTAGGWTGPAIIAAAGLAVTAVGGSARRCAVGVLIAAMGLGAILHHDAMARLDSRHIYFSTDSALRLARVRGVIATEPIWTQRQVGPFEPWFHQTERTRYVIEVTGADVGAGFRAFTGRAAVFVKEHSLQARMGDTIEAVGQLYRFSPSENPGSFDWQRHNHRRGIWVGFSIGRDEAVRIVERGTAGGWDRWWQAIRQRSRALLVDDRIGSDFETSGLLETMVLGRRGATDPEIEAAFIKTGCCHYLAVSGAHLAILSYFVWHVVQWFGARRRTATVAAMLCAVVYLALVDPRPPILRATIMVVIYGTALLLRRRNPMGHALVLSALILLIARPTWLFDAGFQLSYMSMIGIGVLSPMIAAAPFALSRKLRGGSNAIVAGTVQLGPTRWRRTISKIGCGAWGIVALSLGPWLANIPLMLIYFDSVPLWGWLNTPLLLPFVSLIVIGGFATVLVNLVWPSLGAWTSLGESCLAEALLWTTRMLVDFTGTEVFLIAPPAWLILVFVGLAIVAWFVWRRRMRVRWLLVAVVTTATLSAGWYLWPTSRNGLRMAVLSVGRGTAIILELPDSRTFLYDAGTSDAYDVGAMTILPYLRHRGVASLDGVMVSHSNLDHYSGLLSVADRIETGRIVTNPYFWDEVSVEKPDSPAGPMDVLAEEMAKRDLVMIPAARGTRLIEAEDVVINVLWPPEPAPFDLSANDSSLVLRIRYLDHTILLCGDIEQPAQQWLLEHEDLQADALVLPHHGSTRTSLREFLAAVAPGIAIESSSTRRGEEHVMAFVNDQGGSIEVLNTAEDGAILVDVIGESVSVTTTR